jgi:hypothetical protein
MSDLETGRVRALQNVTNQFDAERARTAALARGDRKAAQAMEDADADFRAGLAGQAANKMPGTVADSLASIGGGGGVFQGHDPSLAAMDRAQRAQEQTAREAAAALLREIRARLPVDE